MDNMKVTSRPIRIRKNSRKSWTQNGDSDRPLKRLFTPEIKKLLKDWLVRRRENPYPSREEKKALANETGLTYTQICNWFANWRRKLKNTSSQKKSWGNLIKNYNFSARGNVEQFSISSNDSIWVKGDADLSLDSLSINQNSDDAEAQDLTSKTLTEMHFDDHNFKAHGQNFAASFFHHHQQQNAQNSQLAMNFFTQAQYIQQQQQQQHDSQAKQYFSNSNKFKNHIIEKYLRGLDDESNNNNNNNNNINNDDFDESLSNQHENNKKPELSKWIESTVNFQPSKNNYNIDFVKAEGRKKKKSSSSNGSGGLCEKELLAAETLVLLQKNFRTTKFYNS